MFECKLEPHISRVLATKLVNERSGLATKANSDFAFYHPPLILAQILIDVHPYSLWTKSQLKNIIIFISILPEHLGLKKILKCFPVLNQFLLYQYSLSEWLVTGDTEVH